jgi:hypothetical protein
MEPMTRSAKMFCQGDLGALTISSSPRVEMVVSEEGVEDAISVAVKEAGRVKREGVKHLAPSAPPHHRRVTRQGGQTFG